MNQKFITFFNDYRNWLSVFLLMNIFDLLISSGYWVNFGISTEVNPLAKAWLETYNFKFVFAIALSYITLFGITWYCWRRSALKIFMWVLLPIYAYMTHIRMVFLSLP